MIFFFASAVFAGAGWVGILYAWANLLFDYPIKLGSHHSRGTRLSIVGLLLLPGLKLNAIASEEMGSIQSLRPEANVAAEFALVACVSAVLMFIAIVLLHARERRRIRLEAGRQQENRTRWKDERTAFLRSERLHRKHLPDPKRHRRKRHARKR